MFNRIKAAWRVLRGQPSIYDRMAAQVSTIYVRDNYPPRWVQVLYYHDKLVALDTEGTLWLIDPGDPYLHNPIVQEWLRSPRIGR